MEGKEGLLPDILSLNERSENDAIFSQMTVLSAWKVKQIVFRI